MDVSNDHYLKIDGNERRCKVDIEDVDRFHSKYGHENDYNMIINSKLSRCIDIYVPSLLFASIFIVWMFRVFV